MMSLLTIADPKECGLDVDRWNLALEIVRRWTTARDPVTQPDGNGAGSDEKRSQSQFDRVPAAAVMVARYGKTPGPQFFGRQQVGPESPALREDAMFLVASITKPIVSMAAMLLVERGQLTLNDRVADFLPEFGKRGKYGTTIRNLLTHTSGLPDMLPNNAEMRQAKATLSDFVTQTCAIAPEFPPGRGVQYQSMGFAVLGAIIEQITGTTCADFLRREFFDPLGMNDTFLGAPDEWFQGSSTSQDRIAEIRVAPEQVGADWNWNSRYWKQLGAPWGGLLTTPMDLGQFAQLMLNQGKVGTRQLISRHTIAESTRNQLEVMKEVPDEDRRFRPWGFGWRLQWPNHANTYGDLVGHRTYGHWGATGTLMWIDPDKNSFAMILTTQPLDPNGAPFIRLSNAIMGAFAE